MTKVQYFQIAILALVIDTRAQKPSLCVERALGSHNCSRLCPSESVRDP